MTNKTACMISLRTEGSTALDILKLFVSPLVTILSFTHGSRLTLHLLHPSIIASLLYCTHTHLQGVCELWCSLPQRCYAPTRLATSSHHALFCVVPVGRTSCLSMNGSNLSILIALVSLSFCLPLFFSVSH